MNLVMPPTAGRVVWFRAPSTFFNGRVGVTGAPLVRLDDAPMAATVAYVWHDRMVNLSVVDHAGQQFNLTSVRLLQGDEEAVVGEAHAAWMPYQVGQAKAAAVSVPGPTTPAVG